MDAVDEFVKDKILPKFHDVVAMLRDLMRELAPQTPEEISYGMPMWKGRYPLAWISSSKNDITFSFTHGVEFDDPYGLLQGRGKHARGVKLRTVEGANQEALRHYIRQAVDHDGK